MREGESMTFKDFAGGLCIGFQVACVLLSIILLVKSYRLANWDTEKDKDVKKG